MFSHLQVHSAYSLLYGTSSIEALIARAKELGCAAKNGAAAERAGDRSSDRLAASLARLSSGLVLAIDEPALLTRLAGRVERLYAGVSPRSVRAVSKARRLGLPLLALGDATFLGPEDYPVHRVLRAVAANATLGNLSESDCDAPEARLFAPDEAAILFRSYPEALKANEEVAKLCAFDTIFDEFIFPSYTVPPGESPESILRTRTYEGARKRYGELDAKVVERIEFELDIIFRKKFADYFLVVADIVKSASRTCGRGSGAASIVSYCLGITNVDPIRHNLYFQRFLNPARLDPPDIDVDFAWDERDDIIRAVIERFGPERSARVANHNCFGPRSALRETAKAYGLPDGEISEVEHRFFHLGRKEELLKDPLWGEIIGVARRLVGLPRGLGMHCGGLVIAPGLIRRCAPIEASAEGYPLLQWEKDGAEAAGLVKIDLLGNRSLAVIRDALANLAEEGIVIDPFAWSPIDDAATQAMLARGDSMGVFYIESPAMRQLQKKTGRGDYGHIVIHSSIIRPAANNSINEYVRRLRKGRPESLHPKLDHIFDETYGILCYQEDISKTAVALAGFEDSEADKLRKILSKKAGDAKLKAYEDKFFAGCRKNGVDDETIRKVWKMILSFEGFSFCKPHSASYAMVSFQARGGAVIVGFMAISKLSRAGTEAIIAERDRRGAYAGLEDFSRRISVSSGDIVALVAVGSFDDLEPRRARDAQTRLLLRGPRESSKNGAANGDVQAELLSSEGLRFGEAALAPPRSRADPASGDRAKRREELLGNEYRYLGFLREQHPIVLWKRKIDRLERVLARDIESHRSERIALLGWPITKKEVLTAEGRPMSFVSFEDETAIYETVLFPEAYARFHHMLYEKRPFLLTGKVEDDLGAVYLNIRRMTYI